MPSFLHPNLLWILGLPALGVVVLPVLIHLINMMRHRRVEWAAMEFLLASQKKHRTWILLKQLLLLLLRMLAVAMVVVMLAQPQLRSQWGDMLGGIRTHHIVLLDDSFSMSDRWGDTDAFSEAKKVIDRIGANAVRQDRLQSFTLLRFSRAGRVGRNTEADLLQSPITSEFSGKLEAILAKMAVTETGAEPLPSLQAVVQLLGESGNEHRILYVVSDFRARQWGDATDLRKLLQQFGKGGAEIHLVNCVDRARPNLAITSLSPGDGIRAAGVPWFLDVTVQNFGETTVRNVPVTLEEDRHGRPSVTMGEILPGKTATERFPVRFANAGWHAITARLESDAVAADNHRYCAVDIPADVSVLLVEGDAASRGARYLALALAPGDPVRTGIRPQIETPRYLSAKPLEQYPAINLVNFDRLEQSAVRALETYVASGGGVVFFLGEHSDVRFINEVLYREGGGLFPAPLAREAELPVDRLEPAPDVQVDSHYIFRVFGGKRNTFLQTVTVRRYFALPKEWTPAADSAVRVVARLRNGAPLVLERAFGKGRVLAFLTTAAPTWNNWAQNPSFVVVAQDLQAYLAKRTGEDASHRVGTPLEVRLDPGLYQPGVRFVPPAKAESPGAAFDAARDSNGMLVASFFDTDISGEYEVQLTHTNGEAETRRYAVNVDAAEGDLAAMHGEQLATRLEGVPYRYVQAAAFQSSVGEYAGRGLGDLLLYVLILLLLGEQIMAWSTSYHLAKRRPPFMGDAP